MYRHGRRLATPSKASKWLALSLLFFGLLVGGIYLALKSLDPQIEVKQAAPVTRTVTAGRPETKTLDTKGFKIDLPTDWEQVARTEAPYNLVRFQSKDPKNNIRYLEVYQDTIPPDFPVNRVLALEPYENKVTVPGSVSENCKDFTPGKPAPGFQGVVAKWQNIEFVCDVTNFERSVIGTSSKGGINSVSVKSPSGEMHKFLFVYTDNAITPNFSLLYNALNSFAVK
jgi:hypothetical protein